MIIKKLREKLNKIKICAVLTAICFMISTLGANLYAIPVADNSNQKYEDVFNRMSSISNEYGKITSSKDAKSDITVINIQDLHCHPQTQRNISKIINEIENKYNLKKIYVEGGYGSIDTSWLNQIKDENIRKQAIEKLVEEGLLTGSEYYKLTSNNTAVELKGIDEESLHKDNVKRLSWLIAQQDKYKQILNKINKEITILEKRYVNNRNKRFNNDIEKYLSNKIDSKQFYKQLTKYVIDINKNPDKYNNITAIRLEDYPNIYKFIALRKLSKNINIKEVTQQLQVIVNELKNRLPYGVYTRLLKETENLSNGQKVIELVTLLCKKENIDLTKYKDLNSFLESNYITRNINPIDLVQEERQLIGEIRKALSYNNEEYEITFILDFGKYFKDYLEYKLTDADWKYFETAYETFRQLYGKYASIDRIKEIEQDFDNINKYYTINDQRNNIFVKNLLENEKINLINTKKERSEEEILKESKEVIIAVTGGFHSSELEQMLASNDVNTIVITPKIYEDIKQANDRYIELIGIQSRVNSQALSYTIASCTSDIDKQRILLSIVRDILGDDTEILEKILGKKVDLSILDESTVDLKTKNEIREVIENTIEQVLKTVPLEAMKGIFIPDIDEIMLDLAQFLVNNGIFFSEGMIFDIENSKLNGENLQGIPAEIYSRMMPALQKALLEVTVKEEQTSIEEIDQDIQDLYEDTGATESAYIYLEDINDNPELFIELLKDSIINKKLIVLRVFRNPIDIDSLDREQQKKLYDNIRDMFFKIYTDRPLYNFISQPENKEFIQYDIHFFLLEILENSFMHGNKGFDKPIYIYMDLNEQNEINNLKIYNKNSQEDDNFQMRLIRMKLALLGGRHKSNVLMKQNPYRTFEVNDNFKGKFYKVSSEIKSSYDEQATISLKENHEFISYFSIVAPFKDKNKFFYFLHETAHIWEELVFRTLPISLSVLPITAFLPVPAILALFTISQLIFIKAHGTSFKEQLKQRFLPTTILSIPYVLAILFAPGIPAIILSTIIGIGIHKYLNLILKAKLNIFPEETAEKFITVSEFLANKQFIDLNSVQEQQLLAKLLDTKNLSKQDITDIVNKIDLDDVSQSNNLLETFYKQKTINHDDKKMLVFALAQKADVNNSNHLAFLKNILLSDKYSLSVDENVASILVEKFDFHNKQHVDFLIDYFKTKNYDRKYQSFSLNNQIINKIDINDSNQIKLLGLFSFIDDNVLLSLLSKFDFSNKDTLQSLFKIILKLELPQNRKSFSFVLNKLDLKNDIDFNILHYIISKTNYINGTAITNIFNSLDFNDNKHLNLIKEIINKENIEITVIESFKEHIDINNPIHLSLLEDLIGIFFLTNTIDSKLIFFERIKKILQKINIEQLNVTERYVFKVFTDALILNMQKVLSSIQNENIRTKDDKITVFLGFNDNLFNELIELVNVLSGQEKVLSENALNNLKEAEQQISYIKDMINEKITIKEFAEKFDFRFLQQTPNTYIDSNRYSFTKLLSLFPKKVLKHTIKKHSPTYIMEKEDFNPERLKKILIKFNAYMKLLDENMLAINKFDDVTSFDSQFDTVLNHIKTMINCLSVFNKGDADFFQRILNELLEKINNGQTTVKEQKDFSLSGNVNKTETISNLINKIHQTANLDFVSDIRDTARLSLRTAQNVFVSKDDRTIAVYNLSQKPMNPEIKRLILMLIENPDFTTTDRNSHIFIKDNIFLWNGLLGDHSARVLIDFNKDSRNIFVDFSEGERTSESRSRILALQKILSNFGLNVKLYNNNNSLIATINKDTGLTNTTDICDMAQKAMIALSNAASLHRTNIPKQVIDTATLGVMDIYKKCFFVSAIENNIIKTKVNNLSFFNRILSYLQLPKIPFSEPGMISYVKVGPFFKRQIKTLGQNTINKYINWPIEQAFATGYLKINENGVLERNNDYNPILSVANKLNMFLDNEIGDSQEIEMLNQGAILSQIPEQNLNLKTCGQLGRYILKTGYIKLSNGSLNDNVKGDFLSVRILVDENGVVRYSESELVGLPEFIQNKTGRIELTSDQLQDILSKQGYDISIPENLTGTEILNYRVKLQEDISSSKLPIAYGVLMSTPKEVNNVVGVMGKTGDIFIDKFASPENVDVSAKNKISLFVGGSYSSHAGIVLREYHKTAMIVNDSQLTKEGMKIKFYQSKDNIVKMGEINTQEIEETEITLQNKDIIVVDLTANKLILFPNSVFKNILFDLQKYIDNQDAANIKNFIEKYRSNILIDRIIEYIYYQAGDNNWLQDILSEYMEYDNVDNSFPSQETPRFIQRKKLTIKNFLPHITNSKVYRFGERESLDETRVGTKAANQAKFYLNIDQLKQDTGVTNVAAPNGVAIDYSILEDILGQKYISLYEGLERLISKKDKTDSDYDKIQVFLTQITNLIDDISNSKIEDYIGKNNLRVFKNIKVIVRSSGVGEDSQEYSAAGIAESYGNVEYEKISDAIRSSLLSFFSKKAIDYMLETGKMIKPAVLIEEWIDADKAGIMMSETSDGNRLVQVINGKGEDIVSGRISPYSFEIDINTREKKDGNYTSKETITGEQLEDLIKIMEWLEQVEGVPVDIEFIIKNGIIYIVQVRPITTLDTEYEEEEEEDFISNIKLIETDGTVSPLFQQLFSSDGYAKSKKSKKSHQKKSKGYKHKSSKSSTTSSSYASNSDIRQPEGLTAEDVIERCEKLANSKDSFDSSLEITQEQTKKVLLRAGLSRQQVDNIDFSKGLPDYVISLLKNKNSQIVGTTINPRKTLIENLKDNPILFSLALETLIRVYESNLGSNPTLGNLLSFIEQRYSRNLYEATCTDLRGYFGEIYLINTLIAGIIPDKRAGPIIIRPELPTDNNIRGFDIYDIDGVKIQVKTGGSEIVHHHFQRYWAPSLKDINQGGMIAIPVITTKNVKNNSFPRDRRVQGMDVTTETVTKFAHEFISALHGIAYKRNNPAIRNLSVQDLIDTFKGFDTENSMTIDDLMVLLNKNNINTSKKTKKKERVIPVNEVIKVNIPRINTKVFGNQDIVVNINSEQTHVLYVNDNQILLNEEGKKEISAEEYPLYGIESVEYDQYGDISYVTFGDNVTLSNLTFDGEPKASEKNNIDFSEEEVFEMNLDTNTDGTIDVYLDDDVDTICHLIKNAAVNNKLIVFHFFRENFKTSELTPSQLLEIYKKITVLISNRFQISDIFPQTVDYSQFTDYGLDFFLEEILKNALLRGNLGNVEEPIALHIKLDENKSVQGFSVYNKQTDKNIDKSKEILATSAHLMVNGDSKSTDIMNNNPVREYSFDEKHKVYKLKFRKAEVSLRSAIDMVLYRLEQDYKKSEKGSISDIALQTETTVKDLFRIGFKKYKSEYLIATGKKEKDLTIEELFEIEKKTKNYRYTLSGIFHGVILELFSLFSKDFIPSHRSMSPFKKTVVRTIRILSVGIGISAAVISFSIIPVGIITASIISSFLGFISTIFSGAILHFISNVVAIITKNYDFLLQQDIAIPTTKETTIYRGSTLTDEDKEMLESARKNKESFYDSIFTYQPNKALQKDVEEIFKNLIDAMVTLGWITKTERDQYKLHYYYQPTSNAFTIKNSKDVFMFSQLLYEIDKKLKKDGKALTKDIVAAIMAHELRHTIQENRSFEYKKRGRQFGVNKGSEKRMEYDADTGGLEILDMAGYNPKAMQELLSFFCETTEEGNYSLITLLDAHPNSKDRLKIVSSILESKDIAFMNMDKEEQPLSVKSIKNYFTFVASITKKILSLGYRNRIIRKLIINYMLSDKSKYFTSEEKAFLEQATNLQRNFIYELLFPQTKESKYYFTNLSEKEKEELFDFVIDTLNIYKIKDINSLFFGEIIPNINMTKERWEKLNKFKRINAITINMKIISDDAVWFYANNQEYLSDEELQGVTYRLGMDVDFFLESYNINTEQYMKTLFGLLKTTKMYIFSQHTAKLLDKIEKAQYFSQQEKLEFIYLLYSPHHGNGAIPRFLKLNKFPSVTESILNLFKVAETIDREEKFSYLWDYIIEEYGEGLSKCSLDELEKLSLATKAKEFDTFVLGWFIKSINPNFKIYFVSNYQESKNPQFFDGICLWPKMFSEGNNTENILKMVSTIDNSKIIEVFKILQNKMIESGIVNEDISFITYQILKNKGLLDEYKYEFKYLLCFLKNQDEIEIETTDSANSYPIEYLKDIVEVQLPQASFFDLGSKYRFTKYFIHLAELYSFSIDYKKESFESAIELIKKHFNIAGTFFKKNSEGEYATDEQKRIGETEENLRNMEITRAFIYELHEVFGNEPISKSIKFKSGKDSYQYDYFEINKDLLEQVPTAKQAQQLIDLFAILKRELPKENVEIYAKIIYTLLKKNSKLSVFKSSEENIKLLDFLFEGFSKAKDDYINEILDKFDITPSQYEELKNKTTLVQYEQQTEETNTTVAKEEVLYFTIENITNQEDRINFLLWLMSSDRDSKYYRTYTLGNIKCKNNDDVVINFDSFRTEFQLMSKTERENVIRTIFLGSNGILNKKESKEKNISEAITGLQNVLFNNLFFADEKVNSLNVAMANMFKKIFEIVFRNISDERKVVFVNNLFSALIDIKNETEKTDMEEGELRAKQLGRLIVSIGVNSGMAVLKLLQILSNNKVFEKLDNKYGYIINDEVSKVKSENEPLSKLVIFKYLERLGISDKIDFVGKCLGSASIGLTYLLKFAGKKVFDVVKIKRPNIMKNYEEDFYVFSKIREYVISDASPLPEQYKKMIPKAEHLKNLFNEELNFGIESENLRDFAEQLKERNSEISVPQLINDGKYLFTQTSAKGSSLNNLELSDKERKEINFKILKEFFTEVFFDAQSNSTGQALYHADLHAGNIFIDENGNITFIDLGGVGKVDIEKSKSLKEIFIFLCLGNYNGFISSLKEFNRNIPKQLSTADKSKIKEILERKSPLESKFADLFEIFNNLEKMDKDFLMFMQSISKIAVYIDELELIGDDGKPNLKDILEYGNKLLNKDLSGIEKFVKENNEILKKLAVSLYIKNYNGFINALSLYNKNFTENLSQKEEQQIKNILQSNISLQNKIENLIELFSELNVVDENFLLLLEVVNNIIHYIGEAELKDIIKKLIVSKTFNLFSKKKKQIKNEETENSSTEKDSILEIVLSKCTNVSIDQIKMLDNILKSINKDTIKMCLKNSIVNLNLSQITNFVNIANYLYEKGFITEKNEQDKTNLLFKVITRFDFSNEQIKELFEIDARFIDEILTIIEREDSKRKQKKLLKNFLKEKNKLDLDIMNIEVLKTILDFSDKNNSILAILPSDIAKNLLTDTKKLKLMMGFLNDGNDRELDLSLIVRLIDLPNEILEILSNNRYSNESDYMYNLHKFCDLYEKCYDENKFYNIHKFVLALLNFTTVKYRDTSSRYYKFQNKIKNLGVLISWKIPILNKFIKFINAHKSLTAKDKQIINIFKETIDIKTLEELSKTVYRLKLKTILNEAHKLNIPISIDDIKFKILLRCVEKGIGITSEVRTKIANTRDFNEFKQYADNLLANKKKIMEKFGFLDRNAYIWEEVVFKVIPVVVSAFNPIIGFYIFVSSQIFFTLAHFIPKLLGGKKLNDAFVETKELIFSLPTLISFAFTLLMGINTLIFDLGSSFYQVIIPVILAGFSIPSIIIHKQYNEDHSHNPLSIIKNIVDATTNRDKKEKVSVSLSGKNEDFSEEELNILMKDTNSEGYIDIYLDDDIAITKQKILEAAKNNKFIILHMFRDISAIQSENISEIYLKITRNLAQCFSNDYGLNDIFPAMGKKEIDYTGHRYGYNFFLEEIIKNVLVHGYKGLVDQPIGISIKLNDNDEVKDISTYSRNIKSTNIAQENMRLEETKKGRLNGYGLGQQYMSLSYLRSYEEIPEFSNGRFFKVKSVLYDEVNEQKKYEFDGFTERIFLAHRRGLIILPENMEIVNTMLQQGKKALNIAWKVATMEAEDSFAKDEEGNYTFIQRHQSSAGKQGAKELTDFIGKIQLRTRWLNKISPKLAEKIVRQASIVKHVIIDYRTIKASGIRQAIELFGMQARLNEEGQISVGIIEDIEEIKDSFTLINTGIKIEGSSIYRIKNSELLMYGAKGQTSVKVAQVLNGTKEIKQALKEMGIVETENTETEGVVMVSGIGIEMRNGILEIGEIEIEGKTPQQIREYITSALEVKRAIGIMYGQKTIIDLKSLTGSALIKAIENGRARKVITEEQYEEIQLSKEKISELKGKGIEIYIASNEINKEYRQNGISGQIIRENGKTYIYDYYSMEKTELDEITEEKELSKLEEKIVNGENLIMIDIELLKKNFQGSNIIESFTKLGALTGKIKMKMGIGNIGIRDIENVGYNIRFEEIPEISERDIQKLIKATTKEEILNIIGQQNGFAIILMSLKAENVNRFKELITERILAKKALTESATAINGTELEDKKIEIMLGKMLYRQINYTDKQTVKEELMSQGQLMNVIEKLKEMDNKQKGKETQEQQELVNTIIQLILLYDGQRVKGNQLQKQTAVGDISTYRSMLAAA